MKNILLVGASSDSAVDLFTHYNDKYNFIRLSHDKNHSDVSNFDVHDYQSYGNISEALNGLVYFPGNINLKPFESLTIDDYLSDYKIHILGLVNILKVFKRNMNYPSSIVLFSSVAAKVGMPFHASTAMCKSAVRSLTRTLAVEWSPKIRVNCISPSLFKSKMSKKFINNENAIDRINNKHPLKRFGTINDISSIIEFLLSDSSSWITGQDFSIDGGLSSLKM